ncbi:Transmembrane protein 18 [Carpediemonas membranifera]|uniref:Transmembrane protein 18 n=1 Tax=Carpediemonas membranifera TaxID=201153 RepID=A0A8J6AVL0_9EUKA|nr:Transmembrane protein 18 [Carpediemonas membranifera]|eukprot:KAG9392685.1 Transmembrane protein 18 [Carpediemonas membranifera]
MEELMGRVDELLKQRNLGGIEHFKSQFSLVLDVSKEFLAKVEWRDPIIVGSLSAVFVMLMISFMLRKSIVLLIVYALLLLILALVPLLLHSQISQFEVLKTEPIASMNYFEPEGIFVFLLFSLPCIAISIITIGISYIRTIMALRASSMYKKMNRKADRPAGPNVPAPDKAPAAADEPTPSPPKKAGKKAKRAKKVD